MMHGNRNSSKECKVLWDYGKLYNGNTPQDKLENINITVTGEELNVLFKKIILAVLKEGGGKRKSNHTTMTRK